jgi:hypothetical protein
LSDEQSRGFSHSLRTTDIPKVVRHYTNKIGYQGILNENIIGIIGQIDQGKVFFTQAKRIGGTRTIAEKLGISISKARF